MTKFSVNLNKFALLRNSRGNDNPNLLSVAQRCLRRGVHGLTVHPRPDERHTRFADVFALSELIAKWPAAEFNVEGYPTDKFIQMVLAAKPHQCTLVPDEPGQLTSDHGWDAIGRQPQLADAVQALQAGGVRVSVFLDPVTNQVEAAQSSGADRIELYTEPYAAAFGRPQQADQLAKFAEAARHAQSLNLGVNAGHDLNQKNLPAFLQSVPEVLEVSIGHAVVCESFDDGLEATLDKYIAIVRAAQRA